jgi:methylmalonyl-CoA mutase, N-terminal domain
VAEGRRVVVGVNAFTDGSDEAPPPTLQIGAEVDEAQRKRLAAARHSRSQPAVDEVLAALTAVAAEPTANLVPAVLDAVRAYATVGEITGALASVFGRWAEDPVL